MMRQLRTWWLRCLLESYRHDELHLAERIDRARCDMRRLQINASRVRSELNCLTRQPEAGPEKRRQQPGE